MKTTASVVLALMLAGCATPGYVEYTQAVAMQAQAHADARRATIAAITAMANNGDATTKTMAVVMLSLGAGQAQPLPVEPPRDTALQWAAMIVPSVTALAGGYFGYRLGVTQSNNQAMTTQSSYGTLGAVAVGGYGSNSAIAGAGFNAITAFRPVPVDWSGLAGALKPSITTTTSLTNTTGGDGVLGAGTISRPTTTTTTTSTDNHSVTNPLPAP